MSRLVRAAVVAVTAVAALLTVAPPSHAITGGTEDVSNTYSNVGMVVFYQPDGRFRCSGTLIAPRVVLTAAHCTFQDIGQVVVTFDPVISRTEAGGRARHPACRRRHRPGRRGLGRRVHRRRHRPARLRGRADVVPRYAADAPGLQRLHRPQELERHGRRHPRPGAGLPTAPLAPENYLDQFAQPRLNRTEFLTIGYGTEVRQADSGPQTPTPERQPIVRRYTTEIGQKLTDQILQTNGNEHDPRAGGGTCFGDSGGPLILGGYVVGDTSYGFTNNCRYLGGYQRVDVPVRDWLLDCLADLACPTKGAHGPQCRVLPGADRRLTATGRQAVARGSWSRTTRRYTAKSAGRCRGRRAWVLRVRRPPDSACDL